MKKTMTILMALAGFIALNTFGNDTEARLVKNLEQRAEQISATFKKLEAVKRAYAGRNSEQRERALRLICQRMKSDAAAMTAAIDSTDLYLQMQGFNKKDELELKRTNRKITELKHKIDELKQSLATDKDEGQVATK